MKELRRKHEAAQLAVVTAAETEAEGEEQEGEGKGDEGGADTGEDDRSGVVAALRKVSEPVPRRLPGAMVLAPPIWRFVCNVVGISERRYASVAWFVRRLSRLFDHFCIPNLSTRSPFHGARFSSLAFSTDTRKGSRRANCYAGSKPGRQG